LYFEYIITYGPLRRNNVTWSYKYRYLLIF